MEGKDRPPCGIAFATPAARCQSFPGQRYITAPICQGTNS